MDKEKVTSTPWSFESKEILMEYGTSEKGLDENELKKRLAFYGPNVFNKKEKRIGFSLLLRQFSSPLIFILIGAGVLSVMLGDIVDMIVIALAVIINAGLGFYREYHAEHTLEKLTSYIKDRTRVIRGGVEYEVDSSEIVIGDILSLGYGMRIPADIRLLTVNNFKTDEAILTGESLPVSKKTEPVSFGSVIADRKNIAYAGTLVVEGFATGVVYATGEDTEIGKIAKSVSRTKRVKTPIQKSVDSIAWLIFIVTLFMVIGIFFLGLQRGQGVFEMLKISAAVAVGAVPEALPIALTVILAKGAEKIASKKGIIRKLAAAETLGSTTVIMTDKTGTLTKADMQLTGIHTTQSILSNTTALLGEHISGEERHLLELSLKSTNIKTEFVHEHPESWVIHGRPFEKNIAKTALSYGITQKQYFNGGNFIIPFNSSHKFSVIDNESSYVVMGAPDILLKRSSLEKDEYLAILSWIEKLSGEGKRLVGIATVHHTHKKIKEISDVEQLTFLGILSFYDAIREEVPEVMKKIESSGVRVVLVTGDLKGTALSVAKDIGWNVIDGEVMTGEELRLLSDEELRKIINQIKIFARVTPEDKMRIGKLYQLNGEIVAMTGDGVNDAPALKAMDIGVSLGSGSDVAKSAADLVLLDDNFKIITLAIIEGRKIVGNIRKTFVYLLSNSLDAIFLIGGSLLMGFSMPLSALQIIWVNFFTGSLPALAFAFDEEFDKKTIQQGFKKRKIFTVDVAILTFGVGLLSSFMLFLLYVLFLRFGVSLETTKTVLFLCFASYVLAISFSFRSLYKPLYAYNPFSNKTLTYSVLGSGILIVLTVSVPFMRSIFDLSLISPMWIVFIIGWIILNVCIVEIAKYILRSTSKSHL